MKSTSSKSKSGAKIKTSLCLPLACSLVFALGPCAQAQSGTNLPPPTSFDPVACDKAIEAVKQDIVMRAMGDELKRNMQSLKLPNYPLPYFGSYYVTDEEVIYISGSFGALSNKDSNSSRKSEINLRVGDEKLDNTTASGGMAFLGGNNLLVRDDNYDSIRRDLWLQTDKAYKAAVESLAGAKAQLKYVNIEDRPDSFSKAKPVISIKDGVHLEADIDQWAERVKQISAVFKQHPQIQDSNVSLTVRARTKRMINSEGTAVKYGETGSLLYITASAYCPDGMVVSDFDFFAVEDTEQFPDQAVMQAAAQDLCKRVEAMAKATRAGDYQGPVLFEKQAAAQLVSTMLPSAVCAKPELGMGFGTEEDVKLGKQVLSKSLSVFDDPIVKEYKGLPLKSGWVYDYEGVPAQKLALVDKGILKTMCSTRTPTRVTTESNGHSRGGSASPGHLFVSTDGKATLSDLRLKLLELGKKDELQNVIVVRRMMPGFLSSGSGAFNPLDLIRALTGGASSRQGAVCQVYSVDLKTGKEELIRGARLKNVPKKNLMTMEAASDDAAPYVVDYPTDRSATTISMVTPSVLLKDVELAKPPRATEQLPYLKNPYFEKETILSPR